MQVQKSVKIDSSPSIVWQYLTSPSKMKEWMGEPEMNIEVLTDWKVGNSIIIKGFHHVPFQNSGIVLRFEPFSTFQYSHLSSVSHLPELEENYSIITFNLHPDQGGTLLKLEITNFPTETIFRHLDFYWTATFGILKKKIETGSIE